MGSVSPVKKLVASNKQVVHYKATSGFIFQLFVKSQVQGLQISMGDLMTYPLTLTPPSVATIDGFFAKTNKAKGMSYLTGKGDIYTSIHENCALIQDGNSSFYMSNVPPTMKTISQRIFASLPKSTELIFSTDTYCERLESPKSAERNLRGCGERYIVEGINVRRPHDWGTFLTNDENKRSFIRLLRDHWSSPDMAEEISQRALIFIEDGQAYKISSSSDHT